jgi:hypothetical protein
MGIYQIDARLCRGSCGRGSRRTVVSKGSPAGGCPAGLLVYSRETGHSAFFDADLEKDRVSLPAERTKKDEFYEIELKALIYRRLQYSS